MEREVGGGIGMGNTCKPMAVSFQCMTKSTTIKNKKNKKIYPNIKKKMQKKQKIIHRASFLEISGATVEVRVTFNAEQMRAPVAGTGSSQCHQ